ncbi:terminase large subunit domain-containing protein [Micromonospora chalcea]|uniref:terminase large subunit domain-containing protein n=1 Tax=Micromonospora chalcea TaxID=1874 RepID=UPI003D730AFB
MPRTLVRAPWHDRNKSLGWLAVAWLEHFTRHGPGDVQGQPVEHGDEYTGFIVDCYAVGESPQNNHLLYDSSFLSRPKGTDKSGLAGRISLFEALGPCRFAGWAEGGEVFEDPWGLGFRYEYAPGEPMGRALQVPVIRIMATEENQASNVYDTVYFNLTDDDCPLFHVPGVDAGKSRILLPWGGSIIPSTASSASKDGGRETHLVLDESHLYNTPELRQMYKTVTRNLRKRKKVAGTWFLETTTMFAAGEDSMAERTFNEAQLILEGRKRGNPRLLYDHRWGEVEDLTDVDALRAALEEAYGDAKAWMDIDGLIDEFQDTRNDVVDSRRYFLNAQSSAADAWLTAVEWDAAGRADRALADRDLVTLGFDGSRFQDATALVACRVSDGHLELLECWERPESLPGSTAKASKAARTAARGRGDEAPTDDTVNTMAAEWQVDRVAVDAAVAAAMKRFEVVAFYCDPAHMQDYVDAWERDYGDKMRIKASPGHPCEWWTNRPTAMVRALERFYEALVTKEISFTPAADRVGRVAELARILRRHALNARRRPARQGLQIAKDHPKSPRRIDSVMAAVLAVEARGDAIAAGVKPRRAKAYAAKRIR